MCIVYDMLNKKFGKLIVISRAENGLRGEIKYNCKCDCGNTTSVYSANLKRGFTSSCGCIRNAKSKNRFTNNKLGKKYNCDEHYFDNIDIEEKAYLFGFLMADGYNDTKRYTVSIHLANKDRRILFKFKNFLNFNGKIKSYKSCTGSILKINSKIISKKLNDIGMVKKKSLILKFPEIIKLANYNIQRHFIRGYFDGDGSVSKDGQRMNILGTKEFVLNVQKLLMENCDLNKTKLYKNKNIFMMSYGGLKQMNRIYHYLYDNSIVCLNRKKQRFINYE